MADGRRSTKRRSRSGDPSAASPFDLENGIQHQIDFLRDASRRFNVGTFWDAGGADPIGDEIALMDLAEDAGINIDRCVMSRRIFRTLALNQQYRDVFPTFRTSPILSVEMVNEVRETYGLPTLVLFDAQSKRRVAGADTNARFLDDRRVIYYSSQTTVGHTVWGRSSYVGEDGIGAVGSEGGPVVFVSRSLDPLTYWTHIDAVAVPVLANPDHTFSVGVLA